MNTLVVTPELFQSEGGIARIVRLYLKALCENASTGDEVRAVALLDEGDSLARGRALAGGRLASIDNARRSKLRFIARVLWRGMSSNRIVCGHVHHLILARAATWLRPSARYFLVAHGIEVWRPFSFTEKLALHGAARILCVSEYTRRQMLRFDSSLDPARLVVIPNTFDPQFQPATDARHHPPGPDDRSPRILVVSRLDSGDPYKGIDTMIEAMPGILRVYPKAQLRIVGGGSDHSRLASLAASMEVDKAIIFAGRVSDAALKDEYAACDLFALPSRKEGFGLVYLEAMNFGKPCLAARAGGAPEVVDDRVGSLVEYGNVDQIVVAVADLMGHPRAAEAIFHRARGFSFPIFSDRLAALLGEVGVGGSG